MYIHIHTHMTYVGNIAYLPAVDGECIDNDNCQNNNSGNNNDCNY